MFRRANTPKASQALRPSGCVGILAGLTFVMLASFPACAKCQVSQLEQNELTFAAFHPTEMYAVGETVGWVVSPRNSKGELHYRYTVKQNNHAVIQTGKLDLTNGSAKIEIPAKEPEMLLVEVTPDVPAAVPPSKTPPLRILLGAAVSPTLLKPSLPPPDDFHSFWDDKLAQQAKIPMNPKVVSVPSSAPGVDLYLVTLDSLGSHAHGYLAKPSHPGKFPALIVYQWAGVYKLNPGVSAGYAKDGWLTFNVDSHDKDPTEDKGAPVDYALIGGKDREQCYYLNMFLRDTRVVEYVSRLKDWDGKTIVVTGGSMGGWQSLFTAGLNPKLVTDVIVLAPVGLDTNADLHGRHAGYPYWPSNDPAVMNTARYFDPVNLAPEVRAKTIIGVGMIDTSAPAAGIYTEFNLIRAPKQIVPILDSGHHDLHPAETQAPYNKRLKEALDTILHTGTINLP